MDIKRDGSRLRRAATEADANARQILALSKVVRAYSQAVMQGTEIYLNSLWALRAHRALLSRPEGDAVEQAR